MELEKFEGEADIPWVWTPSFLVVRLRREHLRQWYDWFRDPYLLYWMSCPRVYGGALPYFTRSYIRQRFKEVTASGGFAIETHLGRHIGNMGFEKEGTFFMELGEKEYWGKGYGREILEAFLKVYDERFGRVLRLWVFDFNLRALRLYESCGFRETGRVEGGFFRGGKTPCFHLEFLRKSKGFYRG